MSLFPHDKNAAGDCSGREEAFPSCARSKEQQHKDRLLQIRKQRPTAEVLISIEDKLDALLKALEE